MPETELPKNKTSKRGPQDGWSPTARRLVSVWLVWHLTALVFAAWAAPPSAEIIVKGWRLFGFYLQPLYLNHAHRFYSPQPGPTMLMRYTMTMPDGSVLTKEAFPKRDDYGPRLQYQRHLALTNALSGEKPDAQRLAESYALHLYETYGAEVIEIVRVPRVSMTMDEALARDESTDKFAYFPTDEVFFLPPDPLGRLTLDHTNQRARLGRQSAASPQTPSRPIMLRPSTPDLTYWQELTAWLRDGWNRFWFTPADPTTLGSVRLATGLMLLYVHGVYTLDLAALAGPYGWVRPEVVGTSPRAPFDPTYLTLLPEGWPLYLVHGLGLLVLALFTVGLFTRVTSILSLIVVLAYINRNGAMLFGLDQITAMLTLYLAISPSGAAVSLDRMRVRCRDWRRQLTFRPMSEPPEEDRSSVGANLAIRLIQVHMCLIYFCAGLSKHGVAWWDGTAPLASVGDLRVSNLRSALARRLSWLDCLGRLRHYLLGA